MALTGSPDSPFLPAEPVTHPAEERRAEGGGERPPIAFSVVLPPWSGA